ncbi:type II toxin-antitoxin system VapC family toxin [Allostreptomyces psammosilenae]|uniref:Ribonuclease VapC n=1 Tax=Allostreptomyces psammosilenae TaxID=1892865 RepID=A0A853A0G7_9ACTN|nr:type II toxin-antitoxin system VapC family toxin [Allostreptomyces psammosilenae]NYI07617.1 putative nucleic acid-binding protein [Allostreptomyces psammosilenae]
MIVVDASALVLALTDRGPRGDRAREELARDPDWAAPEHVTVEVLQSVRGLFLAGQVTLTEAADVTTRLETLPVQKIGVERLLSRIWELKDNLTPDDAAYVAVAELLNAPLVTADLRLARASGPRCEIRRIDPAPATLTTDAPGRPSP